MDLEAARERIQSEQARIAGLADELRGELGQPGAGTGIEVGDTGPAPGDGAVDTFEREKDLSILEELEAELAELEAALARIDDGTYGVDEVTGAPIDPDRLDAVPSARTNADTDRAERTSEGPPR
jgi:RNA polymerase-binding transcription factor DksA